MRIRMQMRWNSSRPTLIQLRVEEFGGAINCHRSRHTKRDDFDVLAARVQGCNTNTRNTGINIRISHNTSASAIGMFGLMRAHL